MVSNCAHAMCQMNRELPTTHSARNNKIVQQSIHRLNEGQVVCRIFFYRYSIQTKIKFFRIHARCWRTISFLNREQK